MAEAQSVLTTTDGLFELVGRLEAQSGFAEVIASLQAGHASTLGGVWGSSCAGGGLAGAPRSRPAGRRLAAHRRRRRFLRRPRAVHDVKPETFPAWEREPGEPSSTTKSTASDCGCSNAWAKPLRRSSSSPAFRACCSRFPAARKLAAANAPHLQRGESIDLHELLRWLVHNGFHSTTRRGVARRVLATRRHCRRLCARLVRPGTDRVVRRRDGIDPPLRSGHAAQPGDARRDRHHALDRATPTTASTSPATCPTKAGSTSSSRPTSKRKAAGISNASSGRKTFTASPARCGRSRGSLRSPPPACRPVRWRRPATWASNRSSDSAATSPRCATSWTPSMGRPAAEQDVFVVCQTEAESQRLQEVFAPTRLAAAGKLHYPTGTPKGRAFGWSASASRWSAAASCFIAPI